MKIIALKVIATLVIATLFSGCSNKEVKYIKPKLPKLRTCAVSKAKVNYKLINGKVCLSKKDYKMLKKQNYRLRVCNELLNKQNRAFNKQYVEEAKWES